MSALGTLDIQQLLGRKTIHPFPARMAPSIAADEIGTLTPGSVVLDPMVGSGTVVAIARAKGHHAIGFDLDPLAALSARVWTRPIDAALVRRRAERCLRLAKSLSVGRYPAYADKETRKFIRYWFDPYVSKQMTALAQAIDDVKELEVRETLWCSMSRLVITKQAGVSLAMDLAHSRPHREFRSGPIKPFAAFLPAVEKVIAGCLLKSAGTVGPAARVRTGDVRSIPLRSGSVDLVFTSPPYLNAIDYLRCSKFSLVWMGYSTEKLRAIRASSIGAEISAEVSPPAEAILEALRLTPAMGSRESGILRRYIADTFSALKEIKRVLAPNGRVVYVIGENTIRGTYIPTGKLISSVAARVGLAQTERRTRELPSASRYLPPPGTGSGALDGRMRLEVVLSFEHAGQKERGTSSSGRNH